jgi:hypothetical protein
MSRRHTCVLWTRILNTAGPLPASALNSGLVAVMGSLSSGNGSSGQPLAPRGELDWDSGESTGWKFWSSRLIRALSGAALFTLRVCAGQGASNG